MPAPGKLASVIGQAPPLPLPDLIYRGVSLRGFFILDWIRDTPRERLERVSGELAALVEQPALSTVVEATYPLDQYPTALRDAQKPARTGKVLFTPNGAPEGAFAIPLSLRSTT